MKKIDLYIFKKFVGTFSFSILLFTAVAVIIDLSEKIDGFVTKNISIDKIIFEYYLNFIPFILTLLSPLFVFIAVIFFTSRMASNSEFIALLSSGVSFYRLLLPYFFAAAIFSGLILYANHFLVPNSNKERLAFEGQYIYGHGRQITRNVNMQIDKGVFMYIDNFTGRDSTGYKFALEKFEDGELKSKLRADRILWDNENQNWEIRNYTIRVFHDDYEELIFGQSMDTVLNFTPRDLSKSMHLREEMNTTELREYIDIEVMRGSDNVSFYEVELYRRTADAFTVFIMTLIGFSIASRKIRGGMGMHIVIGLGLSAAYIIFIRFSTTFSTNGDLPSILGVWIPNLIFGLLAIVLMIRAPK
ncbi:MAG: YjgP/YjgQ family permease [Chitinophagaceae bacterium]|nr:MAG: YjgP/YjgQ family permease [Chitinophagaceae bacterium]